MNDSPDDAERLAAVQRYHILDTPPDGAFDRITAIAARLFQVPIALVTVVDHDRIWFKSRHGLAIEQIDREPGLCASVILQDEIYAITDALQDPRTLTNSLVRGEFGLRFYAAAPLTTQDGHNLGTLCIVDHQPRQLTADETQTLADLAAVVMDELELRLSARQQVATTTAQQVAIENLYHKAPCGYHSLDANGVFIEINDTELSWLGYSREAVVGQLRFSDVITPTGQATFATSFPQFKQQGRVDDLEFELVRADGSTQWILISAIAEYDEQGNYVSSRSTAYNISDRKRGEIALRQLNQSLEAQVAERTAELEASNHALHLSNLRFRSAFDYAGIGMALVGLEGQWLEVNRSLCEITGYGEAELLATTFQAITHPDDLDTDLDLVRQLLNQEIRHYHLEKRYRRKQGHWVWILLTGSLVVDEQQMPLYFVAQIQDINERKQAEIALQQELERLSAVVDIQQKVALVNPYPDQVITVIAESALSLTQADGAAVELIEGTELVYQAGSGIVQGHLGWRLPLANSLGEQCFTEGQVLYCANIESDECGSLPIFQTLGLRSLVVVPLTYQTERVGVIKVFSRQPDAFTGSDRQTLQLIAGFLAASLHLATVNRQLKHLSTHDGLTQLANRRSFDIDLQQEWARLLRVQAPLSLILCDIDYFKPYNDTYGHPAGDVCLQQVAQTLTQVVKRPADLVARYGGEEFALVLPDTDHAGAEAIARAIQQALAELALYHGASPLGQRITLSLGIASVIPTADQKAQTLIDQADAALYTAKQQGRDRFQVFGTEPAQQS